MKELVKRKMPKKKPPRKKPKQKLSQKERFLAYAKELGADETGEEFERAFKKITKPDA